ncbi:Predicted DNA-binding transcriptional regulator YafY, contains an HTH and WYL domains [Marinospirillum celere]|uniref:Predicted DNA-binding transcriptional regulator YafY, contains an HTH and WYL domains n=1 Tax=Marinospirillum celere TaxID=1122252 RepID=A0A1I1EHU7_9GAMM|nr:WYL domain-containing protein [Marinospirillum celere]SFB86709.1 Predicted DNA-binding transcriptional regulator YafY, contains an HTH and WYL domains [Marinospirillum celere]
MSESKDTLLRLLTTLQLIPRHPGRIATTTLQGKLADRGFSIDLRSLQRDLKEKLSSHFPLICDESVRPFRWSFIADAQINLPELDTPAALTLCLAEEQLRSLLPASVADQLKPQFQAARQHLDSLEHNQLAGWAKRVRALPNGKALIPAPLKDEIWSKVSEALLHQQQLEVTYLSRAQQKAKTFTLHPVGLVSRYSLSYLIAQVEGYDNLRHFALHRLQSATLLDRPSNPHPEFDLDAYIQSGALTWKTEEGTTQLIADVHPQLAWILKETPLSEEQTLAPIKGSEWERLEANVVQDKETLWWIHGLNDKIHVHEPQEWVEEIKQTLSKLNDFYGMAVK